MVVQLVVVVALALALALALVLALVLVLALALTLVLVLVAARVLVQTRLPQRPPSRSRVVTWKRARRVPMTTRDLKVPLRTSLQSWCMVTAFPLHQMRGHWGTSLCW